MSLTRREQAEYDRLREKSRAGRARDEGGRSRSRRQHEEDDEDGVVVFSGRHAENFLDRMFGSGSSKEDEDDVEDDDEDDVEDDDEDDVEDEKPPPGNRFFRR